MTSYSCVLPRFTHGIYAFIHTPTKQTLFGYTHNLRKTFMVWVDGFEYPTMRNRAVRELITTSTPADWQFKVWDTPLGNLEESYATLLKNARAAGVPVLNADEDVAGPVKKSVVLNGAGRAMTNGEVAAELGITTQGVVMRLRYYRAKGIYTHTLADLKAGSQRYRKRAQMERMAAQIEAAEKEEAQTS